MRYAEIRHESMLWKSRLKKRFLRIAYGSRVSFGRRFMFRRRFNLLIESNEPGAFTVGDDSFFNNDCSITVGGRVTIGSNCLFGEGVRIFDHDHNYRGTELISHQGCTIEPITIGDNCWFGSNVVILKGVNIGANSVIAAGTVLNRSVPPNSLVYRGAQLVIKDYRPTASDSE